ncbi:MAG: GNAT family N-acetyltransferase [Stenotrophomonas maltophilia]
MAVRTLMAADLEKASHICMAAFMGAVAQSLPDLGIETFARIASVEGFRARMAQDNVMLAYAQEDRLIGIAELKEGRHVAMLFVDPAAQQQGVGKALMAAMIEQARAEVLTVSASLSSVPAYERYGFACAGEAAESSGLRYQPMEMCLAPRAKLHAVQPTRSRR